jgi:hypothetical protein
MTPQPPCTRELRVDGIRTVLREAGPANDREAAAFIHGNPGSSADWAGRPAGPSGRPVPGPWPGTPGSATTSEASGACSGPPPTPPVRQRRPQRRRRATAARTARRTNRARDTRRRAAGPPRPGHEATRLQLLQRQNATPPPPALTAAAAAGDQPRPRRPERPGSRDRPDRQARPGPADSTGCGVVGQRARNAAVPQQEHRPRATYRRRRSAGAYLPCPQSKSADLCAIRTDRYVRALLAEIAHYSLQNNRRSNFLPER